MIKTALNFLMKASPWRVAVLAAAIAIYLASKFFGEQNEKIDKLSAANTECEMGRERDKRMFDSITNAIYMAERDATIKQQLADIKAMKEQIESIKRK